MNRCPLISLLLLLTTAAIAQNSPVPLLYQPLAPTSTVPGHAAFTLRVGGTGFVSGAVVNWNGSSRMTTFISGHEVDAAISAADVAQAGTATVTVTNPGPGGGTSNVVFFTIRQSLPQVAFARRDTPVTPPSLDGPLALGLVTADFNKDGKQDIAIAWNSATSQTAAVQVYLGNGDGTFQPPIEMDLNFLISIPNGKMQAGDFNGDGKVDIAMATPYVCDGCGGDPTPELEILLGTGDGHFTIAPDGGNVQGWPIGAADFNGDGKLDLLTNSTDYFGDDWPPAVNLGNGDGTFGNPIAVGNGFGVGNDYLAAIGDFNGDGKLDVAVPDGYNGAVDLYFGNGNGTFQPMKVVNTQRSGNSAMAADVNHDGKLDIVTDGVDVLLGSGDGTFTDNLVTTSGGSGAPMYLQLADFNNDNKLDLMYQFDGINFLLGNGDGTFGTQQNWNSGGTPALSYGLADFYGDGRLDAVFFETDAFTSTPEISVFRQTTLNISPTFANMGAYVGQDSQPQTFTLTNIGTTPVNIGQIVPSGSTSQFHGSTTCGGALSGGNSCTITVTFHPTIQERAQLSLQVNYTGTSGWPQYIQISAVGF